MTFSKFVLSIKKIDINSRQVPGHSAFPVATRSSTCISFIVPLKSHNIKKFILNKKRTKKQLSLNEVFDLDNQGSIFVNVFLPAAIYNLLRLAKTRANNLNYRYVWCRAEKNFVRERDGQIPVIISSESDLEHWN